MRFAVAAAVALLCSVSVGFAAPRLERVKVSADDRSFVLADSGKPFVPWGFNYDRDHKLRLIEEYWDAEWETVAADFREMKDLGANVVRVHLQFAKFMEGPDRPNARSEEHTSELQSQSNLVCR